MVHASDFNKITTRDVELGKVDPLVTSDQAAGSIAGCSNGSSIIVVLLFALVREVLVLTGSTAFTCRVSGRSWVRFDVSTLSQIFWSTIVDTGFTPDLVQEAANKSSEILQEDGHECPTELDGRPGEFKEAKEH